ncbi:Component of the SF3b subcomplex of the U2 snRNP [Conoideocrella luteorostrata]|uniref:Component of the SF3b subcomplex of the U2 snRNP n=1 Tax=Conoideocrella luteorostrata TaxID=1105319 RepID=A0AAJ0CHE2_9HYPO|nr:Component of the SF3b subcomplex of the U2 snRNP [Conoideocrella luteorostrata]
MPAVRHSSKRKPPPDGFSDIENDLLIFSNKMKDAQNKPPPTGPKYQAQWEIFQISHQRSRYIYDLYYQKEAISKQLYDWLLKNGYADAMLIAKWKKQGYEKRIGSASAVDVEGAHRPIKLELPVKDCCKRELKITAFGVPNNTDGDYDGIEHFRDIATVGVEGSLR